MGRWWHCDVITVFLEVINTGPLGYQELLCTRLWTEVSSAVVPHFEVSRVAFYLLTSRCQFLHCRRRWGERSSGGVCVTEHWLAIHHCNTSALPSNRVRERGTTQVGPSGCSANHILYWTNYRLTLRNFEGPTHISLICMRGHKNLCTFRILLRWFCYNQLTVWRPQYAVRILLLQPAGWLDGLQSKQRTNQATE